MATKKSYVLEVRVQYVDEETDGFGGMMHDSVYIASKEEGGSLTMDTLILNTAHHDTMYHVIGGLAQVIDESKTKLADEVKKISEFHERSIKVC